MGDLIPNFTKEDFQKSTAPYEYLYQNISDNFIHEQLREQINDIAISVGFKGFKGVYKKFSIQKNRIQSKSVGNVTDFSGQPKSLESGEWIADDTGIYCENNYGKSIACNHPILPKNRILNIDTNLEKIELTFRKGNDSWKTVIVDKSTIASPNSIIELSNHGVSVSSENSKSMIRYLQDLEHLNYDKLDLIHSVTRLGWIPNYGFSPYVDSLVFDGDANYRTLFESVKSTGDRQSWFNIASEIRHGTVVARIVLAASFASTLVKICNCLPFFVHLWSTESETGKTVALKIAASVWANPDIGTYIQTFDSTKVGREKIAAFCNSLPLMIDELQLGKDTKGKQTFDVYALAEGVGRTRGNKFGGIEKTPTWNNCILTTGETPITQGNSGAGALNRVIDIECLPENAVVKDGNRIVTAINSNYGFAGKEFIQIITGKETIIRELFEKYNKELQDTKATQKQSMAAALILTADKIASEFLFCDDRELLVKEIQDFLLNKNQININLRAYNDMCDWVNINRNKFNAMNNTELYGLIENNIAYVFRSQFEMALENKGYSCKGFISWLKSNSKLISEPGRDQTRKMINGEQVRCYAFFINDTENSEKPFDL